MSSEDKSIHSQILPIGERDTIPIPLARWNAIRNAYVGGEGTLEELTEKYGFPSFCTVEAKCGSEGWVAMREERQERLKRDLINGPAVPQSPQILSPSWAAEKAGQALADTITVIGDMARLALEIGQAGDCTRGQAAAMAAMGSMVDRTARFFSFGGDKKSNKRQVRQARIVDPPIEATESAAVPPIVPPAG